MQMRKVYARNQAIISRSKQNCNYNSEDQIQQTVIARSPTIKVEDRLHLYQQKYNIDVQGKKREIIQEKTSLLMQSPEIDPLSRKLVANMNVYYL